MERVRTKDLVGVLAISVGCLLASTAAYATQITGSYTITETYSDRPMAPVVDHGSPVTMALLVASLTLLPGQAVTSRSR